jgi:hypothetical protein
VSARRYDRAEQKSVGDGFVMSVARSVEKGGKVAGLRIARRSKQSAEASGGVDRPALSGVMGALGGLGAVRTQSCMTCRQVE